MNTKQKILILIILIINSYLLFIIYRYWKADIYYNLQNFDKALAISPNEPIYISKKALVSSDDALAKKAVDLAPLNQNIRKIFINNLFKNSDKKPDNLFLIEGVIKDGIDVSPNDPKLYYQLGILQLRINKIDAGIQSLEKSVELKPNYKEGRFALGLTYIDLKNYEKAKENLEYILKNIDLNDELTKKYLEDLI